MSGSASSLRGADDGQRRREDLLAAETCGAGGAEEKERRQKEASHLGSMCVSDVRRAGASV